MSGLNSTASLVGNIAEQLNAQSYQAMQQTIGSLPTVTSMASDAYSFTNAANANLNSTNNALAQQLLAGTSQAVAQNQQTYTANSANAISQYNAIAQTGKHKK